MPLGTFGFYQREMRLGSRTNKYPLRGDTNKLRCN